jgi:phage repressor protein C with HTH and peptisase S24 domain
MPIHPLLVSNLGLRHVLRDLRERLKLSQDEAAAKAGVTGETISRIERGKVDPKPETLNALAPVYGVEAADLLTMLASDRPLATEAARIDVDVSTGYRKNDIPVIGEGEASPQGELFWDDGKPLIEADEWMSRPHDVTDPRAYAVRVRGDSMVPAFYPGMRLIVSPNIPVKTGHRVYVELHGGERLVKVARRQKSGWILESINPAYEPRFVSDDEVGTMHKIAYAKEL